MPPVGLTLASLCRRWTFRALWLLWPAWVWFCVMATANHYWLDVVAGIGIALLVLAVIYRREVARALGLRALPLRRADA